MSCLFCKIAGGEITDIVRVTRFMVDQEKNQDAIIVPIDEKRIREDLAKLSKKLKVPAVG